MHKSNTPPLTDQTGCVAIAMKYRQTFADDEQSDYQRLYNSAVADVRNAVWRLDMVNNISDLTLTDVLEISNQLARAVRLFETAQNSKQ